ncbi:unnamed protein product [Oikopleura dioica]|uniref:Uncharacterized protein n=1 Tax=Oikopleura dioica TaxID=34765 RepID=E4XL18_OIKDI|nr:unnamed protein product [Oikopleura dioica]
MNKTSSDESDLLFEELAPEWVNRETLFWIICGLLGLVVILSGIICCFICKQGGESGNRTKRESSIGIVRSESMSVKYYQPQRREQSTKLPISV